MSKEKTVTCEALDNHKALWESSGLSQRAYCQREKISYRMFTYHLHKMRAQGVKEGLHFIEAPSTVLIDTKKIKKYRIKLVLPNKVALFLEEAELSEVIQAAGNIPC